VPNGLGTVSEESEFVEEVVKARARRRLSHDQLESKKIILNVEDVQGRILSQEDTDGDMKITVTDDGPKLLTVGTLSSHGHNKVELRGHYALANLLQELAIASDHGRRRIVLDSDRLHENPVQRLSRLIKHHFWDALTRRMDADGIEMICNDPKNRNGDGRLRIYIPFNDSLAWDYYQSVAKQKPHLNLDLVRLPEKITPEYVYSIYSKFGVLSLALKEVLDENGNSKIKAVPYVVPGGRFNEMYGWDSYFESLGLIVDGRVELAKAMVENFTYQINHYGKILNANRSYYLTRSQPPFFTDMILQTYRKLADTLYKDQPAQLKNWLMRNFQAAIKEYYNVWMSPPRYVDDIGLSRYHPEGYGMPPETESSHFDAILTPYAEKMGISVAEYSKGYAAREIIEPELDEYFIHDRAVRESGHDTTYRLEGKCAYIIPVDLNCLLYKYEIDIGNTIRDHFDDDFVTAEGQKEKSSVWFDRAEKRKELIEKYLWNEQKGMYFDYNLKEKQQSDYESVTNFFVLWAGIATRHRAAKLIPVCLKKFEVKGGLVTGTQESKGITSISRPNRQWDYPFGNVLSC
jgi:alpha,alpha-trehalase